MNEPKREIVYWDCDPDAGDLCHKTRDEAIEAWLDSYADQEGPITEGEILVRGFAPMVAPKPDAGWLLELLHEGPWEELCDPDGYGIEFSAEMMQVAEEFAEKITPLFEVWACEEVHTETVDVAAWLAEHPQRPQSTGENAKSSGGRS